LLSTLVFIYYFQLLEQLQRAAKEQSSSEPDEKMEQTAEQTSERDRNAVLTEINRHL
jgi:hypothetical protein